MSDKRDVILTACAREIARHGVRGMRVSEVSASAGVSTALLYYHFTDRAGLLDAVLPFITERAQAYRLVRDAPTDSAWDQLINHICQEFHDDPLVAETTLRWNEVRPSGVYEPSIRAALAEATAIWRDEIEESIRLVQADGELAES